MLIGEYPWFQKSCRAQPPNLQASSFSRPSRRPIGRVTSCKSTFPRNRIHSHWQERDARALFSLACLSPAFTASAANSERRPYVANRLICSDDLSERNLLWTVYQQTRVNGVLQVNKPDKCVSANRVLWRRRHSVSELPCCTAEAGCGKVKVRSLNSHRSGSHPAASRDQTGGA